jgi:hypothetical protein
MEPGDYFALAVDRFHAMGAPLYAALSAAAAKDPLLCAIAGRAQPGQPLDHLLFAAVEMVLADYPDDALAAMMRPVGSAGPPAGLAEAFHEFCETHRSAIEALVSTRTVQTTFVHRAGLVAAGARVVAEEAGEPLSLVEIGCSAGILTLFDHYEYDFGAAGRFGSAGAALVGETPWVGDRRPKPGPPPKIGDRVGLDLNPIDPTDPFERQWTLALAPIDWAEERRQLSIALEHRAATPLHTIRGDAMASLPTLLPILPDPVLVCHSYCLYQWPADAQVALHEALRAASAGRTIYRLAIDIVFGARPEEAPPFDPTKERLFDMFITRYRDGAAKTQVLGSCDPWGKSAEWLL